MNEIKEIVEKLRALLNKPEYSAEDKWHITNAHSELMKVFSSEKTLS